MKHRNVKAEVPTLKAEVPTDCAKHRNVKAEVPTDCAKHRNVKAEVPTLKAEVPTDCAKHRTSTLEQYFLMDDGTLFAFGRFYYIGRNLSPVIDLLVRENNIGSKGFYKDRCIPRQ